MRLDTGVKQRLIGRSPLSGIKNLGTRIEIRKTAGAPFTRQKNPLSQILKSQKGTIVDPLATSKVVSQPKIGY